MSLQLGDMIGTRKTASVLFGIYAGNGKVIYLDKGFKGAQVKECDLGEFNGTMGRPFVDTANDALFEPAEIVARAKSLIGIHPLPKFISNSESFASWAKTGAPRNTVMAVGRDLSLSLLNAFLQKPVKEYAKCIKDDAIRTAPQREAQFKKDVKNIYDKINRH